VCEKWHCGLTRRADPYIQKGQAQGLSFSVAKGVAIPPSLNNIYKELSTDIPGWTKPNHGCLEQWAKRGVLLLNAVLTVRAGASNSHAKKGWERFTDAVIKHVNNDRSGVVFLLWGKPAQQKGKGINASKHLVLQAAHPSPLAGGKFFGSKHFSQANAYLKKQGLPEIDWTIDN